MKKIAVVVFFGVVPFIVVWTMGIMTFFIVNPLDVFKDSEAFWTLSGFYWFLYAMLLPSIPDLVEEGLS